MILSFAKPAAAGDGGKISPRHLMLGSPDVAPEAAAARAAEILAALKPYDPYEM